MDDLDEPFSGRTASFSQESVRCIVRVRPPSHIDEEASMGDSIQILDGTDLVAANSEGTKSFQCSFDAVLSPTVTQAEVYEHVSDCTASVLDGFNSTIFAYGQTGSGKTHT